MGVTLDVMKALLAGCEVEWEGEEQLSKRRISCLAAAVVIGFCGDLRGEEVLLTSLKGMLKFW